MPQRGLRIASAVAASFSFVAGRTLPQG